MIKTENGISEIKYVCEDDILFDIGMIMSHLADTFERNGWDKKDILEHSKEVLYEQH